MADPKMMPQQWWHGFAVSQEDRNRFASEVFEALAAKGEDDWSAISTGDTLVLGVRHEGIITVTDCTIRRRTRYNLDGTAANDDGRCNVHKEQSRE